MDIQLKSMAAMIVPVEGDENDSGPGSLHIIASSPKLDRDGENLWVNEWQLPLPDHIQIVGDHKNNEILATVGSGVPTMESDNKIHVRGAWAETEYAQDVRKLVNGKHVRHLSAAFTERKTQKGISRELINVSFVNVPSNTDCVVVESKSMGDMPMTPQQRAQAVHDLAVDLGADCSTLSSLMTDEVKSFELFGGGQATLDRLKELGLEVIVDEEKSELTIKDCTGSITTHKFSPAPEGAPPEGADSQADSAKKEAAALAMAKAAAFQITSQTRQYTESEKAHA